MLFVQRDRSLQGGVADDVAVREVFGYDARAGFVFLRDVMLIAVGVIAARGAAWGGAGGVARDLHLGRSKLGVVEEESRLSGSAVVLVCIRRKVNWEGITFLSQRSRWLTGCLRRQG